MKRVIIISIFVAIWVSCNNEISDSGKIETIQLKSSLKEKASNLFKEAKVIPLETTDSSLIVRIKRIEIWNDNIFVLNELKSHNNILCFDLGGKFLFSIDRMGQGPGDYSYLGDFIIDENLNHLILVSENSRTLHFDLQGNFLYDIVSNDIYYPTHFIYLNDSTYLTYNDGSLEPKNISLLYLDAKTMNIKYMSNSINEFYYSAGNRPICINNNNVLCLTFSDYIYDISNRDNVYIKYMLYFTNTQIENKKRLRINDLTDDEITKIITQYYFNEEDTFIVSMYENNEYLAFTCRNFIQKENKNVTYITFYNKADKKTYNSDNIDFDGFKLYNCGIRGINNQTFYCVLPEISPDDKEKIKNSSIFSEIDKQKLLAQKEDDNPVLLLLK
jgi:hypothetical protein